MDEIQPLMFDIRDIDVNFQYEPNKIILQMKRVNELFNINGSCYRCLQYDERENWSTLIIILKVLSRL
jgi:hypothetical protein